MVHLKRKYFSVLMACIGAFLVVGISGCSRKAPDGPDAAALEQQVQRLEEQIHRLESALEQERQTTAALTLAGGQKNDDPNDRTDQNERQAEILNALLQNAVVQIVEQQPDDAEADEVAALRQENEAIKQELSRLQSLLEARQVYAAEKEPPGEATAPHEPAKDWTLQRTPVQKVQFLDSLTALSMERDPDIVPILTQALNDADPEVCIKASELLMSYRSPDILPVIEEALGSRYEQVRLNAIASLGEIDDPHAAELIGLALNDTSANVREEAVGILKFQDGELQLTGLSSAIVSPYEDVKSEALSALEFRGDHPSVPIIMQGLNDPSPEFKEEVNATLSFLVDMEFETFDQAIKWWERNKDRFDEDLFEK